MNTIGFLLEWAIRSSLLISIGTVLLRALRVKDSSVRLAAWTAVLAGSLLIPAMSSSLPVVPITHAPIADQPFAPAIGHAILVASMRNTPRSNPFDWAAAGTILYAAIAAGMILRLGIGLLGSYRLLRRSSPTERDDIRESERIAAPVTLGVGRPAIVLPMDWREWDRTKLDAVVAHEQSHIDRRDPLVQLVSAIHRSVLWFSPLTWFLHSRIVRTAEEASDDAAVSAIQNRAAYAELLLDFVQRGVRVRSAGMPGVPMARYGRADKRIHRILDSTAISQGVTKRALATILLIAAPLAYIAATAKAQNAPAPTPPAQPKPARATPPQQKTSASAAQMAKASPSGYIMGLGTVTAVTATVRPAFEGQLTSLRFKEGQTVVAGEELARMTPPGFQEQAFHAQQQEQEDELKLQVAQAQVARYNPKDDGQPAVDAGNQVQAIRQKIDFEEKQIVLAEEGDVIKAPITGVTGLRLVEAGNMVHPGDPIVVIAQLHPISVIFAIPEDLLPQIRKRLDSGPAPVVEAWARDEKTRIASGVLTATDNQIDEQTGTIKLKATFDNQDNALFPNQFVNVRLKTR